MLSEEGQLSLKAVGLHSLEGIPSSQKFKFTGNKKMSSET